MKEGDAGSGTGGSSRREFVKLAGTTGAIGLSGLAGCTSGPGGDGSPTERTPTDGNGGMTTTGGTVGTTEGSGDLGTVTYGALDPLTGPFGALAQNGQKGADLAVRHINESDAYDFEMEIVHEDSKADPATGQRKAQKLVQQDGARYLLGGTSSSVALAINEFALDNEVITNPIGVATNVTRDHCNPYVFRSLASVYQLATPLGTYAANNLGTKAWFHIADYAYGESIQEDTAAAMAAASDDFEQVGFTRSQFGETNFSSFISQVSNSDAEVLVLGMTGGDLINFVKQARGQGLTEQVDIVNNTITQLLIRQALGEDAYDTYGAMRYLYTLDSPSNNRFVEDFRAEHGAIPDTFAGVNYLSIQMTAKGIQEAGSTDPTEVKDVLPGLEMEDTIVGPTYFRECDHQGVYDVWVSRNVAPESGTVADIEVLSEVDGETAIYPCGDANCTQ